MKKFLLSFTAIFAGLDLFEKKRACFRCQAIYIRTLKKIGIVFIFLLGFSHFAHSQTYIDVYVDQPAPLQVNAGTDTTINEGSTVQLGSSPSAEGGNGGYVYSWSPDSTLDDAETPNPAASPSDSTTYTLTVTDERKCSASDDLKITITSATGFKDHNENPASFSVYPNPASSSVFVQPENYHSKEITITLLNTSGTIIHQKKYEASGNIEIPFNVNGVEPGIYFIRVNNNKLSNTKKIVIE